MVGVKCYTTIVHGVTAKLIKGVKGTKWWYIRLKENAWSKFLDSSWWSDWPVIKEFQIAK